MVNENALSVPVYKQFEMLEALLADDVLKTDEVKTAHDRAIQALEAFKALGGSRISFTKYSDISVDWPEFESHDFLKLFNIINTYLIELENNKEATQALMYLKNHNIYSMLYRNHPISWETSPVLATVTRFGYYGVALSGLIVALFVGVSLTDSPAWLDATSIGLFIGASCYLSGLLYGVLNDLLATRANLPYFLFGHMPYQRSILPTNDRIAQAGSWGVMATFIPVLLASIAFTIAGVMMSLPGEPTAMFIMPAMMALMPLFTLAAEGIARWVATLKAPHPHTNLFDWFSDQPRPMLDSSQYEILYTVALNDNEKNAWIGNAARNQFGYMMLPITAILGLVAYIELSPEKGPDFTASMFESPLFTFTLPVVFAACAFLTLAVTGMYTYINRERKIDDRFNVKFEDERRPGAFYFTQAQVDAFKTKNTAVTSTPFTPAASSMRNNNENKTVHQNHSASDFSFVNPI